MKTKIKYILLRIGVVVRSFFKHDCLDHKEVEQKSSFKDRYAQISQSDWFVKRYKDMSIGELINLD